MIIDLKGRIFNVEDPLGVLPRFIYPEIIIDRELLEDAILGLLEPGVRWYASIPDMRDINGNQFTHCAISLHGALKGIPLIKIDLGQNLKNNKPDIVYSKRMPCKHLPLPLEAHITADGHIIQIYHNTAVQRICEGYQGAMELLRIIDPRHNMLDIIEKVNITTKENLERMLKCIQPECQKNSAYIKLCDQSGPLVEITQLTEWFWLNSNEMFTIQEGIDWYGLMYGIYTKQGYDAFAWQFDAFDESIQPLNGTPFIQKGGLVDLINETRRQLLYVQDAYCQLLNREQISNQNKTN